MCKDHSTRRTRAAFLSLPSSNNYIHGFFRGVLFRFIMRLPQVCLPAKDASMVKLLRRPSSWRTTTRAQDDFCFCTLKLQSSKEKAGAFLCSMRGNTISKLRGFPDPFRSQPYLEKRWQHIGRGKRNRNESIVYVKTTDRQRIESQTSIGTVPQLRLHTHKSQRGVLHEYIHLAAVSVKITEDDHISILHKPSHHLFRVVDCRVQLSTDPAWCDAVSTWGTPV